MKQNMGSTDKFIRALVAVIIALLYLANIISGTTALVLGGIGLIMLLTSLIGFCPLYLPFGITTRKKKQNS